MARYHPGSAGGIRERIDQIFSEAGRLIFLLQPVRTSIIETHFYSQIMSLGLSDSAVDFAISAYGAAAMAGSVIGGIAAAFSGNYSAIGSAVLFLRRELP